MLIFVLVYFLYNLRLRKRAEIVSRPPMLVPLSHSNVKMQIMILNRLWIYLLMLDQG